MNLILMLNWPFFKTIYKLGTLSMYKSVDWPHMDNSFNCFCLEVPKGHTYYLKMYWGVYVQLVHGHQDPSGQCLFYIHFTIPPGMDTEMTL